MSIVHYNGIILPYAQASSFRKEAVQDEFSKTDLYLYKYEITVNCLINTNYLYLIDPTLTNAVGNPFTPNPADITNAIQHKLMATKKRLNYIFNGVDMIPPLQEGNTGTVDAKNGPTPIDCKFVQLTNETFLLIYSIVAHYWINPEISQNNIPLVTKNKIGNNVLSNKWIEMVQIDTFGLTRRRRYGEYVIRSDNADTLIADQLREEMVGLSLPAGFIREKCDFTITPDGLKLKYDIIDCEKYKLPPAPAYEAEGYYEEETNRDAMRFATCRVKLTGGKRNPPFSQADLLITALAVVGQKLALGAGFVANPAAAGPFVLGQGGFTLIKAVIRVDMYNCTVECFMNVLLPRRRQEINTNTPIGFETFNRQWCVTPFSGPQDPRTPYSLRGNAGIVLQAAAYYDPNLVDLSLGAGNQLTDGQAPGTAGKV